LPGSVPKNFALAGSLLLHLGLIVFISYWQWESGMTPKNRPQVVKIKFLPASKAQKNTQKPVPVKAENFSPAQPLTVSSLSIPTLHARTPELSSPAHHPASWTKQVKLSQKKRFKSRRVQPISIPVTEVRSPIFQSPKISQHNHSSTKTLSVRPLPIRKTHQPDSVQAAVPLKVRTTGQLKVAQRRISTRQADPLDTSSAVPQPSFLMKTSISVSKSLHQRPVPATKSTGADTTIQPAVETFKAATESQSRVAALPRKFPENPPTAPDNPSTSNIDTSVVRGLFAGKVRQRIANAKYYPRIARRRGIEGQPVVAFTLDKGGRLMEAGLAKTSGYQLLDQAALEAVQKAAPYPEIPAELNTETFQFKLPISFILK